jgi:hypothetical protein
MELSTLANRINAIAVAAGVIFAAAQIRYYRQRRRRESMLELVRSFQGPTFSKVLRRITEQPDNASHPAPRARRADIFGFRRLQTPLQKRFGRGVT